MTDTESNLLGHLKTRTNKSHDGPCIQQTRHCPTENIFFNVTDVQCTSFCTKSLWCQSMKGGWGWQKWCTPHKYDFDTKMTPAREASDAKISFTCNLRAIQNISLVSPGPKTCHLWWHWADQHPAVPLTVMKLHLTQHNYLTVYSLFIKGFQLRVNTASSRSSPRWSLFSDEIIFIINDI